MNEIIENLSADVRKTLLDACVKIAELHRKPYPVTDWSKGYSQCAHDIANEIRKMQK